MLTRTEVSRIGIVSALAAIAAFGPLGEARAIDYPTACLALQDCVDTDAKAAVAACVTANPTCEISSLASGATSDRFNVTSKEVADRAEALKNCTNKKKKGPCNACYAHAKAKIKNKFFGKLFHGLLANATQLLEVRRKALCPTLPQ